MYVDSNSNARPGFQRLYNVSLRNDTFGIFHWPGRNKPWDTKVSDKTAYDDMLWWRIFDLWCPPQDLVYKSDELDVHRRLLQVAGTCNRSNVIHDLKTCNKAARSSIYWRHLETRNAINKADVIRMEEHYSRVSSAISLGALNVGQRR